MINIRQKHSFIKNRNDENSNVAMTFYKKMTKNKCHSGILSKTDVKKLGNVKKLANIRPKNPIRSLSYKNYSKVW